MYNEKNAELQDVDLILDFKLDIIFSSSEVTALERNEMEKIVNYTEEEIRENIEKYILLEDNNRVLAAFMVDDFNEGKIIDFIYVLSEYRRSGIGKYILNSICKKYYQPLYAYVHKENNAAVKMLKSNNFSIIEESEYKYLTKNSNEKEENSQIKIKQFEDEVKALAQKYGVKYTIETKIL